MTALILDDIEPTRLKSANQRLHHHVRADTARYWRKLGADLVRDNYGHAEVGESWYQRARIVVTLRWPTLHHRDSHNYYPYVIKPLVDGMVDARLLPGDDDRFLIGPDVRRDFERGPHRIVVEIEAP